MNARPAPASAERARDGLFVDRTSSDGSAARLDALESEAMRHRRALARTLGELRPRVLSIANEAGRPGASSMSGAGPVPGLAHRWSRRAIRRLSDTARARVVGRLRDRPVGAALLIGGVAWGVCRALLAAPAPAALSAAGAVLLSRGSASRPGPVPGRRNAERARSRTPPPGRRRDGPRASGRAAPRRSPPTQSPRRTPSTERTE